MSARFEGIVNLMNFGNRDNSSTLEQHCSAMRMDDLHAHTSNRLGYALTDVKADITRLDKEFG